MSDGRPIIPGGVSSGSILRKKFEILKKNGRFFAAGVRANEDGSRGRRFIRQSLFAVVVLA